MKLLKNSWLAIKKDGQETRRTKMSNRMQISKKDYDSAWERRDYNQKNYTSFCVGHFKKNDDQDTYGHGWFPYLSYYMEDGKFFRETIALR